MPIYSSPQSPPTATAVSPGAMTAAQNNSLNGLSANERRWQSHYDGWNYCDWHGCHADR
jgi:hypothetical protein